MRNKRIDHKVQELVWLEKLYDSLMIMPRWFQYENRGRARFITDILDGAQQIFKPFKRMEEPKAPAIGLPFT